MIVGSLQANVNLCSKVANNNFLPVLGDCSKYYICKNQTAIVRQCEEGYLFDSNTQSCTYPNQARCLKNCTEALSTFCYDRTCTKYVLCYAGTPVVRECCDGLQYNEITDRCDYPEYVDCVDNMCTIFNNASDITFLASKAACDKYYICVDGYPHNRTCSKGLQFNPACNCCDFPSNGNCSIAALPRNIASFNKAPPRRANIDCPAEGAHFLPHERTDRYYFCSQGKGVILDCTPGLVYDPIKETCREPEHVGKD